MSYIRLWALWHRTSLLLARLTPSGRRRHRALLEADWKAKDFLERLARGERRTPWEPLADSLTGIEGEIGALETLASALPLHVAASIKGAVNALQARYTGIEGTGDLYVRGRVADIELATSDALRSGY